MYLKPGNLLLQVAFSYHGKVESCSHMPQCTVLQDICNGKGGKKGKEEKKIPIFHPQWLSESAIYCRQGENYMLIGNK